MEPSDLSFADESNVPQAYAVLVFDKRRAAVSLSFQVHHLELLAEKGLVAFSRVCVSGLRTKSQKWSRVIIIIF